MNEVAPAEKDTFDTNPLADDPEQDDVPAYGGETQAGSDFRAELVDQGLPGDQEYLGFDFTDELKGAPRAILSDPVGDGFEIGLDEV